MSGRAVAKARRWLAIARARWVECVLGLCLLIQCLPMAVTRVLPFHDAPGIVGLGGVFAHLDDPATRVREFFDVDYGAYPSIGYFGWAFLAGKLHVPADVAFNVFIAIFCLAGPPLALVLVLRAFGKPPALALLALPVGFHHQIWYGFLGSAAAITGLLLALGFARRLCEAPRIGDHLGLAAATLFVALCHPFTLAMTLAVVAPVVVWPAPAGRRPLLSRAARLGCFLPTFAFLAAWARHFFGAGATPDPVPFTSRLARELRLQRPPLGEDLRELFQWLGGGYRGGVDEVVTAAALVLLGAFLVAGVRAAEQPAAEAVPAARRGNALWLGWAALVLALGYLFLPMKIYWPTYWWGLRVRCVVPLFLVAVASVRTARRGLPAWAALPAAAVALFFAGYVAADFRGHWRGRALEGYDEAVAAIPPGHSLLYFSALPETRYTLPHPYLAQYYVARTGGRATPFLGGHPGSYWVTQKPVPVAPPWGDRTQFLWQEHGLGYDYFLVEMPLEGPQIDPMETVPPDAVTRLTNRGRWRSYRRERPPLPGDGSSRELAP
jgi:hypothetical protein